MNIFTAGFSIFLIIAMVFLSGCIGGDDSSSGGGQVTGGMFRKAMLPNGPGGRVVTNIGSDISSVKLSASATVEISDSSFDPSEIHLVVGGFVTWENLGVAIQDVASDSGTEITSGDLIPGQNYSHSFATAGTYSYHSVKNPEMAGKIVVGS
jgi:plastocyanin